MDNADRASDAMEPRPESQTIADPQRVDRLVAGLAGVEWTDRRAAWARDGAEDDAD